jgi:hypothetical protein
MILESFAHVWQVLEEADVTVRALGDARPIDPVGTAYLGDPTVTATRRTGSGEYIGTVEVPVTTVALTVDRLAFADDVLAVLAAAALEIATVTPGTFVTGDTMNPTPTYQITVVLTVTLDRTEIAP